MSSRRWIFGDGDSCDICATGESDMPHLIVVPNRLGRGAVGEAAIIIQQPDNGIQVWRHEFPYVKDGFCRLRFLDFFGWPRMDGYPNIAGSLGLVNASDVKVFVEE